MISNERRFLQYCPCPIICYYIYTILYGLSFFRFNSWIHILPSTSAKQVQWSVVDFWRVIQQVTISEAEQGSGPEGVVGLCFHTYGEFSPTSPFPPWRRIFIGVIGFSYFLLYWKRAHLLDIAWACAVQLNPALTDFKGLTIFFCYRLNSVITNKGN